MTENPLAQAASLIEQAFTAISDNPDPLAALLVLEGVSRQVDRAKVAAIAAVERDGTLSEKGYRTTVAGLKDLLGWDHETSRRHVTVAEHVGPRVALDGEPLEPVLPATAAAFADGAACGHHRRADELPAGLPDQSRGSGLDRGQPR
ncbi:hypothetical protein ACQEVB_40515 [Pseudonocardia sp. CA-107938]|uniref:hypothetical protein n=1 Tax=Pseudonocardia sp. CA-107938 TaxID=3240021 RepID=UPI003D90534F